MVRLYGVGLNMDVEWNRRVLWVGDNIPFANKTFKKRDNKSFEK